MVKKAEGEEPKKKAKKAEAAPQAVAEEPDSVQKTPKKRTKKIDSVEGMPADSVPAPKAEKPKREPKAHKEEPIVELVLQPSMNIGLVGHVDHGKTTLTERLSGKWTDTHSEEVKRGITIRLGYADTIFYRIPGKQGPEQYTTKPVDADTGAKNIPLRKVSFVDAPGHEALMATMLAGATIMDGALLLVAANETCPQPQTREHLVALQMAGITHIVVVQNKIDLVSEERAVRNYQQIKEFLKGTPFEGAPIVPISAQRGVNVDVLIQTILESLPIPERDATKEPLLLVARSFDINRPGATPEKLHGGVLGGSLRQGVIKVGSRIEIRPGRIFEEANKIKAEPLFATVVGTMTGGAPADEIGPGGSIAVLTSLDPSVVKGDAFTGSVVGLPGKLPPIWHSLTLKVLGTAEELKVNPIVMNEPLMLNVNSAATVGIVRDISKEGVRCELKKPVCAAPGARVTVSRRFQTRFRLIGYGEIRG